MTNEEIVEQLYADYEYLRGEVEDLKLELKIEGRTTESRANGSVRHPNVTILDTYLKQMTSIAKLLGIDGTKGNGKGSNVNSTFMNSINNR